MKLATVSPDELTGALIAFLRETNCKKIAVARSSLLDRLNMDLHRPAPSQPICGGTMLSREQYLVEVEDQGYVDARVEPLGTMSPEDTQIWTNSIPGRRRQESPGA